MIVLIRQLICCGINTKSENLSDQAAPHARVPCASRRVNLKVTTRHMSHGIATMGLSLEGINTLEVRTALGESPPR
jgi:hypothetical protein